MTVAYKVMKQISNGGRIAGRRRAMGDTFEADPVEMHFFELEGVVAKVADLEAAAASSAKPAKVKQVDGPA